MDVELEDGTDDATYLSLLQKKLDPLLDSWKPDIAFYVSGVDVLATDKFGKLKLSLQGCQLRDRFVFENLRQRSVPCVVSMGGGYSQDVKTIVEAHCNTFRVAKEVYEL